MAIDRRTLLKALAAVPAMGLFPSTMSKALDGDTPTYAYILLHGMFFLEISNNILYVATPPHSPHQFYVRRHGMSFRDLDKDIDFTRGQLKAGSIDVLPNEIPQFPKCLLSDTCLSSSPPPPVIPSADATQYRCRMELPLPKAIFAYRTDSKVNFHPNTDPMIDIGGIAKALVDSTGPNIATITCLEYYPGTDGAYVDSYYAEHCQKVSTDDVNLALASAQTLLGNKFVLKMKGPAVPDATADESIVLPAGTTKADENEFREFKEIQPTGCLHPLATPAQTLKSGVKIASAKPTDHLEAINPNTAADVASCPQLGLS
jgi:hypothetical protein